MDNIIHLTAEVSDGVLTIQRTDGTPISIITREAENALAIGVLEYGDTGSLVRALQCLINAHGDCGTLDEDGIFGELTQTALIIFQDRHGMSPADGVCDLATWRQLIRSTTNDTERHSYSCKSRLY